MKSGFQEMLSQQKRVRDTDRSGWNLPGRDQNRHFSHTVHFTNQMIWEEESAFEASFEQKWPGKLHLSGILSENSVSCSTVSPPVLGEMLRMDDMFDWKTLIDNLILNIRTFSLGYLTNMIQQMHKTFKYV